MRAAQGRTGAETPSNLKHQLVLLQDTGSLSSWEKISIHPNSNHTHLASSQLVFTRIPPAPTLCLTRQFRCCKLSDKPSWSSHMLLHGFWSNRQLLMCSSCPPRLPACSKEDLQAAGRGWSSWGWGGLLAAFLLLFLDHRVPPMDNPHATLQLNLMWIFSSRIMSVHLRGWGNSNLWDLGFLRDGCFAGCPPRDLPTAFSSIFPYAHIAPTPHPRLTPTPGNIPTEANGSITLVRATGLD